MGGGGGGSWGRALSWEVDGRWLVGVDRRSLAGQQRRRALVGNKENFER